MPGWLVFFVRRSIMALPLLIAAGCTGAGAASSDASSNQRDVSVFTLRVGCQKSSLLLNLLRAKGRLQQRLGPRVNVVFKE
ncbi:MAG: hypothetical protein ABUL64_01215, partial [Singulisphaera sp.]